MNKIESVVQLVELKIYKHLEIFTLPDNGQIRITLFDGYIDVPSIQGVDLNIDKAADNVMKKFKSVAGDVLKEMEDDSKQLIDRIEALSLGIRIVKDVISDDEN